MTSEVLLNIKEVEKSFPGVKALKQASLRVYAGRVMALMGENGAGKSTLMKVLTGIYQADRGSIEYLGKTVQFTGPKQSQEEGISIIHQELNLIPNLSIAENIFLGREWTHRFGVIDWKRMHEEANKLLKRLNVNYDSACLCSSLSIGEQQMVEIAKALSFDAKVIIMDEPTDALTEKETMALFDVIRELKAQGKGIVYISHRLQEIFQICDDVTVLRDGQFIAQQTVADMNEDSLIEMMVGRKLEEQYPYLPAKLDKELRLQVKGLNGDGIHDVSFDLYAGEILGVSGLMGAGRTELAKMLYGALPFHAGQIYLNGQEIKSSCPNDGLNNHIVYISEDRKADGLVLGMSVKENMSLSALKNFARLGHINKKEEYMAVADFINHFNIKTPSHEQAVGLLSGGNQQKVAIAKGLMTQPQVLILDEPTRGVDVGAKKEIYQLINQFKQNGLSIILISSDMPEVLGMSDRILVMHKGHLTGEFLRAQATQEGLLAAAMGQATRDETRKDN